MEELNPAIITKINEAQRLYLDALTLIEDKNIVKATENFKASINIMNELFVSSPEVQTNVEFIDLAQNIIEDYNSYINSTDFLDEKNAVTILNNRLFVDTEIELSTLPTEIQQETASTSRIETTIVSPDVYNERTSSLNQNELKKLNEPQTPDQKQALIDDEPDVLDTLFVNEDGFVVVPPSRRRELLSDDPNKFRTDINTRRYADISKGIDAKNIKVKNKNFNVRVDKVYEDSELIRYEVVIENVDDNCLVIDSVIQIAGTDYSLVDSQTNVSENEKLLKGLLSPAGVSTDKDSVTNFIKKYRPDFDTVQSSIGSIPFDVVIPDFLDQVDFKSIALCPQNTKTDAGVTEKESSTETGTGNSGSPSGLTPEQYKINKAGLLPYQIAVINEAPKWVNFCEINNNDWPVTRFVKKSDGSLEQVSDTSLVELMKKYQKFTKGLAWCCAFQHAIIASGLENANLKTHPFYNYCSGNDDLDMGVGSSYTFAKNNGLLVPYPVPGCPAYFYKNGKPQHCILILEVRSVTGKADAVYDCITIEGNSTPNIKVPTQYGNGTNGTSSKLSGGEPGKGGKLFYRSSDGGLELRYTKMNYKFMGCAVPKEVQAKANGNYNIFITGNINY